MLFTQNIYNTHVVECNYSKRLSRTFPGDQFVRAVSWAGREGDDRSCRCTENNTIANSALPVDHRRSRPVGVL